MNIVDMYNAKWTDVQVAEEALNRLKKQGKRAVTLRASGAPSKCHYYSKTGAMCGVGILLPEPEKFAGLDGNVHHLIQKSGFEANTGLQAALLHYERVLNGLQAFHDVGKLYRLERIGVPKELLDSTLFAIKSGEGYE